MRRVSFAAYLLFLAAPVLAQTSTLPSPLHGAERLRLHGHPQCQWYVSDETALDPGVTCHVPGFDTPLISHQAQLTPSNTMIGGDSADLLDPSWGHTHVAECRSVPWAEVVAPIAIPCQIVLYHTAGGVGTVWDRGGGYIQFANGVLCHQCEGADHPPITGDPMGIVTTPFTWIMVPPDANSPYAHGWFSAAFSMRLYLSNGVIYNATAQLPFYAMADPSKPENNPECDGCGPMFASRIGPSFPGDTGGIWGEPTVFTRDYLPILGPLTAPWTYRIDVAAYAQSGTAPLYDFTARNGMDLHHGIAGIQVSGPVFGDASGNAFFYETLQPSDYATTGTKHALIWKANTGAGSQDFGPHEGVAALLVVGYASGTGITPPPPTTCTDQAATNVGGPIPCTYPPPPPDWHSITGLLQRLNDQIRICDPFDGKCV